MSKIKKSLLESNNKNSPDLWCKIENDLPRKEKIKANKNMWNPLKLVSACVAITLICVLAINYGNNKNLKITSDSSSLDSSSLPTNNSALSVDNTTINYNSLSFAKSKPVEIPENFEKSSQNSDLAPFDEGYLKNTILLLKGTVTNIYFKDYKYDTSSDKFEPNGKLHHFVQSVVYEVKIDDIFYSKENVKSGDTIKIEMSSLSVSDFNNNSLNALQINHQYILPISDCGDTIIFNPKQFNYADGNITRDTKYGIIYPFAPQIEVTLNNQYLFHNGWRSLINDKTKDVIIDGQKDTFFKIKLRDDDMFIPDLKSLIKKYSEAK